MLSSVCVSHNQFQLGIEWTRKLMRGQTGVTVTLPMNALNGYWDDPRDEFTAVITKPRHDGHYVAEAMCDDGVPIDLTSSILLMSGVKADWRAPSARMLMHRAESFDLPAHRNSMARAEVIASLYLARCRPSTKDVFITLDGNGENREGFGAVLKTFESTPRILTVEMDADVALAQRLVYGEDILFSGAQRGFKYRSLFGGGSHVSTLEHLLLRSNRLITDETRAHVRVLYLDYCGGPVGNQTPEECVGNLERLFARLPRLEVFAVTMSKRHHPNLLDNFSVYVPTPHGFSVVETFVDNPKVVCKVYARNAQPRRLLIPGTWWNHCPKGSRKRKFEGTVTAYDGRADRYRVLTVQEEGREEYVAMRADAVARFAERG